MEKLIEILEGLNPGQQVIKIVNEELIDLMGTTQSKLTSTWFFCKSCKELAAFFQVPEPKESMRYKL